jgi:hypothetical protein
VASVYETALKNTKTGLRPEAVEAGLVALMALDERVNCLDGGVPFWLGIKDITTGGYHGCPFREAKVERLVFLTAREAL